jgi:CRP-like cAMP-binding protein
MTRTTDEREQRRAALLEPVDGRRARRSGRPRFAPLNALADGGWLGVLSWRELRVWLALYRLADGSNRVRASHGTIATRCGIRREHAARTTKRLERRGLLKVLVRGRTVGQAGKRTANAYELLVPEPRANSADGGTNAEDE